MCGTVQMSTVFRASMKPNLILFHLQSFAGIESVLSAEEITIISDMWRIAINKVISNFGSSFPSSEVFGEALFVAPGQIEIDLISGNFELPSVASQPMPRRASRILATSMTTVDPTILVDDAAKYQIKFWICVIFPIILYFVCYQLFTMKVHKDSLLYAKFLTSDARN
jgi:hypothetical protein